MAGVPRQPRRTIAAAAVLAAVAGYVDALGFLATGGLFVSFMSGNTTAAAVDVQQGLFEIAALGAALVVSFVAGVTAAGIIARSVRHGRSRVLLLVIATMLVLSEVLRAFYPDAGAWTYTLVAAGMGAVNVVFADEERVQVAVTYATGGLVAVGLGLAQLFTGHSRGAWRRPLLLWAALAVGAVIGSAVHLTLGPWGLPAAAAVLVLLSLLPPRVFAG
ncbi:YoaK family protein [Microbacterium sp. NPDC091313]